MKACDGVRADAVGRGERQRVGAAGAGRRRAAERAGTVAVVDERDAGRQGGAARASASAPGSPVVVTVNVPGVPTVKVVAAALVIAGALLTVSVKFCVAGVPTPFAAVNVSGYAPPVPAAGVPPASRCRRRCPRTSRPRAASRST